MYAGIFQVQKAFLVGEEMFFSGAGSGEGDYRKENVRLGFLYLECVHGFSRHLKRIAS